MLNDLTAWGLIIFAIWLIITSPILKPWFGIRKPKNHQGKWFQ